VSEGKGLERGENERGGREESGARGDGPMKSVKPRSCGTLPVYWVLFLTE